MSGESTENTKSEWTDDETDVNPGGEEEDDVVGKAAPPDTAVLSALKTLTSARNRLLPLMHCMKTIVTSKKGM